MTNTLPAETPKLDSVELALVQNDLSKLSVQERKSYLNAVCHSLGLNPLTQPFKFISLSGKLTMYASKDCTEQLRKIHGVSILSLEDKVIEGVYVVTAKAQDKQNRTDESKGAVTIANLKGDALANAIMKAETKAKRRVTLSICGLGILDETELDTVQNVQAVVEDERPAPKALPAGVKTADNLPPPSAEDKLTKQTRTAMMERRAYEYDATLLKSEVTDESQLKALHDVVKKAGAIHKKGVIYCAVAIPALSEYLTKDPVNTATAKTFGNDEIPTGAA